MPGVLYLLILISFSLLGCQGQKNEQTDPVTAAHKQIDKGDYTGAINTLEDVHKSDPRPQVKMSLASAYAARAGVKLEQLWTFVEILKAPPITIQVILKHPVYEQTRKFILENALRMPESFKNDLKTVGKTMAAFDLYRARVEMLPYVSEAGRSDLERAVQILASSPTKGSKLYRAVLNLIVLRSDLKDGFNVWELGTKDICAIKLVSFPPWLSQQFNRLAEISRDLKIAYPSKANEFISFEAEVEKLQQEMPRLSRALNPEMCQ
jgi:hypothetical protein